MFIYSNPPFIFGMSLNMNDKSYEYEYVIYTLVFKLPQTKYSKCSLKELQIIETDP